MDAVSIERVYSFYAGVYDHLFGPVFQSSREALIERLDALPGARILEVGVGTGLLLPLYPRHVEIVGIDLAGRMLDRARTRAKQLGLGHVALARMDAGRMAFARFALPAPRTRQGFAGITSSATAAPKLMRASFVFDLPRSLRTRAVMPTLVAVSVPPTNR